MAIEFIVVQDATGTQRKVAADLFNTDEYAQVFKVGWGADGVFTLVEAAAPLPVKQTHGKTVLYGVVNTALAGDNTLAAAVAGTKIKVIGMTLIVANAVTVQFKSGTAAEGGVTNITGPMPLSANGGWQDRGRMEEYLFECATAKSLVLNLGTAVQVSGYYSYIQE